MRDAPKTRDAARAPRNCRVAHARIPALMADPGQPELSGRQRLDLESHLGSCAGCREEARRQRVALQAIRGAVADPEAPALTAGRRRQVLDQAVNNPAGALWPPLDLRHAMGAAAAAVVVLGLLVVPSILDRPLMPADVVPAGGSVEGLELRAQGGTVELRWESDGRSEHRVARATDPRALATAPRTVVQGNTWVDPETNGNRVVYYLVE